MREKKKRKMGEGEENANESPEIEQTRAGVCKTLCPQLPNSNTA